MFVPPSPPPPPNLCVESLNISVVEFGNGTFKEVIKVEWGHTGGSWFSRISFLASYLVPLIKLYKLSSCKHMEEKPGET